MSAVIERDHRADVIEALGQWATCFDVEAFTVEVTALGGVGKIDSPMVWEGLLNRHRIEGGERA